MENSQHYQNRLEAARKRVKAIKGFYKHLQTFLTVFIILSALYVIPAAPFVDLREAISEEVMSWFNLNILVNLGIWALILIIHGLVVFKFPYSLLRQWEERQLKKYLEEE